LKSATCSQMMAGVGHGERQALDVEKRYIQPDDPAGVRGGRARRSTDALGNMIARAAAPSMDCRQRCG
jgi:hypothetical protein